MQAHASVTKEMFKKHLDRALSHIGPLRTLNVRETPNERLEYKKFLRLIKNIIQDINRIESRLGARNIVNEPKMLNDAQRELDFLRNHLADQMHDALNDPDALHRFIDNIPKDYLAKQRLYSVEDYKEWFGNSFEQDANDATREGIEHGYNIATALTNGRDMDERNAYMRYAEEVWDPTTRTFIRVIPAAGAAGAAVSGATT